VQGLGYLLVGYPVEGVQRGVIVASFAAFRV
jgi:hypothetical protein